ncbi:hypothetical protein FRX31_013958 [Thalictrum thalictroides]|uniref:Uncharacterized protein n=1 Tax=Thalictrum thalictroides TaxID=46969 RepID=A0A7J6WJ40_THATH|nr:hypothetical protein FRX31_013958 [Thalictrum thalictroides]
MNGLKTSTSSNPKIVDKEGDKNSSNRFAALENEEEVEYPPYNVIVLVADEPVVEENQIVEGEGDVLEQYKEEHQTFLQQCEENQSEIQKSTEPLMEVEIFNDHITKPDQQKAKEVMNASKEVVNVQKSRSGTQNHSKAMMDQNTKGGVKKGSNVLKKTRIQKEQQQINAGGRKTRASL